MLRAVIWKGDPTSHGGTVLEGNALFTIDGRPVAQLGHMTFYPYDWQQPYIDITTYTRHGNFTGEFVGWSRFEDAAKPIIGMHGKE